MIEETKNQENEEIQKFHTSRNDYSQNKVSTQLKRFAAFSIDCLVLSMLIRITTAVSMFFLSNDLVKHLNLDKQKKIGNIALPEALKGELTIWVLSTALIICLILYFIYLKPLKNFGQTFGKRLLKIRLVSSDRDDKRSYLMLIFRETIDLLRKHICMFLSAFSTTILTTSYKYQTAQ